MTPPPQTKPEPQIRTSTDKCGGGGGKSEGRVVSLVHNQSVGFQVLRMVIWVWLGYTMIDIAAPLPFPLRKNLTQLASSIHLI